MKTTFDQLSIKMRTSFEEVDATCNKKIINDIQRFQLFCNPSLIVLNLDMYHNNIEQLQNRQGFISRYSGNVIEPDLSLLL